MSQVIYRTHVARKDHGKCATCPNPILPGQEYEIEAIPAWFDMEGDVDDEGRNVAYLLPPNERKWQVFKTHRDCRKITYGGYSCE